MSKYQISKAYLSGFTDGVAGRIRYRAELQNPTIDPADGFDLDQLHSAAKMALDAVGFGGGGTSSTQSAATPTTVKVETPDVNTLVQSIAAAMLQAQAQQGQRGGGGITKDHRRAEGIDHTRGDTRRSTKAEGTLGREEDRGAGLQGGRAIFAIPQTISWQGAPRWRSITRRGRSVCRRRGGSFC